MQEAPNAPLLAPILEEILHGIPDAAFAGRLRKVYEAAARTIQRLGDMDLLQYETTSVEGAPDLSLWEEMAPAIRDTVVDVNALLTISRVEFGAPDSDAKPYAQGSVLERREHDAAAIIRDFTQQIAAQITQLGERMRSPQVVADRWNLLADLQAFRSRFRELIGDLVFQSAGAFSPVLKADVVPGYWQEVQTSVAVRAALADLSRLMASRVREAEACEPEDVQWHAQRITRDLDAFARTPAYKSLRAQDKRALIEFRHSLGQVSTRVGLARRELLELVTPFGEHAQSLQRVNQREMLLQHDREVVAAVSVQLEQAEAHWEYDPQNAREQFLAAARYAQALYGRDARLDVFLRKDRRGALTTVTDPAALHDELATLWQLLANVSLS